MRLTLCAQDLTRTLTGRAIDLSEGGMRITTDVVLAVGEGVTCSLELNDEKASLTGQVRWSKPLAPSPDQVGLGIQWERLSDQQNDLLRRWLNDNTPHAELVLLYVPSLREPLRARGSINSDGLQLVAALPQLALGAELEFQLGESGSRRVARVERVELHRRASHGGLEVSLQLQPAQIARSRRNLVYGVDNDEPFRTPTQLPAPVVPPPYARPRRTTQQHGNPALADGAGEPLGAAADGDEASEAYAPSVNALSLAAQAESASALAWSRSVAARTSGGAESRPRARTSSQSFRDARGRRALGRLRTERRTRSETLRVPTVSGARLRRVASWVFAVSSIAALFWALQDDELPPPPPGLPTITDAAAPVTAPGRAPQVDLQLLAATAVPTNPVAQPHGPLPPSAAAEPIAEKPPAPHGEESPDLPASAPAPAGPTAPPKVASVASAPSPSPVVLPAAAAAKATTAQPGLSLLGNRSEVFVPLTGRLDDMRSTIWRDPPAVVIELPSARLDPQTSLRDLRGGGVRRVRVDETARPPQLQIFVTSPVVRFATKPLASGLLVVLEHDLRPMR